MNKSRNTTTVRTTGIVSLLLVVCALCASLLLAGCGSKVVTPSSPTAPVARKQVVTKGTQVARTAMSQLGARYRLGGTTPRGFDCSGLIWWAYRQHGINVPRLTEDQATAGFAVKTAKPGDILVFLTKRGRSGLHTALYTGDGNFVHSPNSGKQVRMDNLGQDYWKNRLIRIRRIVK